MKSLMRVIPGLILGAAAALAGVFLYGRIADSAASSVMRAPDLPSEPAAVITHIAGPVFVIREDETLNAEPAERLYPGDVIKVTEGAAAQVQMADKGSALLGGDTLVRFMRLTGAQRRLELRTEILTGSLSYTVEQLAEDDSIIIEVDDTEYEVQGTDFIIVKGEQSTLLAVSEGTVTARGRRIGGEAAVEANEQLVILGEGTGAEPEALSGENRALLEASLPLPAIPFGYREAPEPVLIEIITAPPDADIYIDGLKTGSGRFRGLLPENTVINVRAGRRGFRDSSIQVTADSNQSITLELTPADIEETLGEAAAPNRLSARLRADYERRIAELLRRFADRDGEEAREDARLAAERTLLEAAAAENSAALEIERAQSEILREELDSSQAENERLRDLIRQIQELTD